MKVRINLARGFRPVRTADGDDPIWPEKCCTTHQKECGGGAHFTLQLVTAGADDRNAGEASSRCESRAMVHESCGPAPENCTPSPPTAQGCRTTVPTDATFGGSDGGR